MHTPDRPHADDAPREETSETPPTNASVERTDTPERSHPWESTTDATITASIDISARDCTPEQRDAIRAAVDGEEQIPLGAIEEITGDAARARRLAKLLAVESGKSVHFPSLTDYLLYHTITPTESRTGVGAARALRWFSETTGRRDLRVTYPASGADRTKFLDHLSAAPVASVDCVTAEGPQGADTKVRSQGIDARLIRKYWGDAVRDGDLPSHGTDCLLLDYSGAGVIVDVTGGTIHLNADALDRVLAPHSVIVATGGYLSSRPTAIRDALLQLPADRYRFVGTHSSDVYIVERFESDTEDVASDPAPSS